jgi:hypothetical protein
MTLLDLIKSVASSWQVIAATVALVLYAMLISYTAMAKKRRPAPQAKKPKRPKRPPKEKPVMDTDVDDSDVGIQE